MAGFLMDVGCNDCWMDGMAGFRMDVGWNDCWMDGIAGFLMDVGCSSFFGGCSWQVRIDISKQLGRYSWLWLIWFDGWMVGMVGCNAWKGWLV